MKKRRVVLIIDDDRISITLSVIRCLGMQNEADIHVLSLAGHTYPVFRFSRYVKSFSSAKVKNDDQAFGAIRNAAIKIKADLIIPIRESTMLLLSERMQECLNFTRVPPLPKPDTLELVRNKWQLYNWLFENGFSPVKPVRYTDFILDEHRINNSTYPLLIKPFLEAGGTGITLIKNPSALRSFRPSAICSPDELLIQPYIPGFDIDFSGLVLEGKVLAYTIQQGVSGKEKFVYSRHIKFVHDGLLAEMASQIFKKLNYSGIAHLDFRHDVTDNTYKLVDFNPRFWRSLLGSLNAGINFPWLAVQHSFNISFKETRYNDQLYLAETNPLRVLSKGNNVFKSDIIYNVYDPLPFLMGIAIHIRFLIKKIV